MLPVSRVSGELPAGAEQVDNIYAFNLMLSVDEGEKPSSLAHVTLSDFLARLARRTVVDASGQERKGWVYDAALAPALPVADPSLRRYALIVDQFEEIITTHPDRWLEREGFFRQLNQAMQNDPSLSVVLVLREDFVAALDPYASLMADRLRGRFYMERMDKNAALGAIREPARIGGRPFAAGVAEKMVDDLSLVRIPGLKDTVSGQYVEPVQLQVVCYQLWENLKRNTRGVEGVEGTEPSEKPEKSHQSTRPDQPTLQITFTDLAVAGDVDQALTQFYEATLTATLADPAATGVSERQLRAWLALQVARAQTEQAEQVALTLSQDNASNLANRSTQLLSAYPQRSLLLALQAEELGTGYRPPFRSPAADVATHNALRGIGGTPLAGHTDQIVDAAFSPDGHWLATASLDGTARLTGLTQSITRSQDRSSAACSIPRRDVRLVSNWGPV